MASPAHARGSDGGSSGNSYSADGQSRAELLQALHLTSDGRGILTTDEVIRTLRAMAIIGVHTSDADAQEMLTSKGLDGELVTTEAVALAFGRVASTLQWASAEGTHGDSLEFTVDKTGRCNRVMLPLRSTTPRAVYFPCAFGDEVFWREHGEAVVEWVHSRRGDVWVGLVPPNFVRIGHASQPEARPDAWVGVYGVTLDSYGQLYGLADIKPIGVIDTRPPERFGLPYVQELDAAWIGIAPGTVVRLTASFVHGTLEITFNGREIPCAQRAPVILHVHPLLCKPDAMRA